jgi:hypothetical protein
MGFMYDLGAKEPWNILVDRVIWRLAIRIALNGPRELNDLISDALEKSEPLTASPVFWNEKPKLGPVPAGGFIKSIVRGDCQSDFSICSLITLDQENPSINQGQQL